LMLFCALFACSFADQVDLNATPNVVLFLEGLAEGVETDFGNVTNCTQDLDITIDDFETGFDLISSGLRDWSPSKIRDGLDDWVNGLIEIKVAIDQCGSAEFIADIASIIADFTSWTGVAEFCYDELTTIWHERTVLQNAFIAADAGFKAGDYFLAGKNLGVILGILIRQS